jgi:hypothetical protein
MDEQVKTIAKKLIEKSEKGEIGWKKRRCDGGVFEVRILDFTVTVSASNGKNSLECEMEIHSDNAGSLKYLRAGANEKECFDLLYILYDAAWRSHRRGIHETLKSLAESLAESLVEAEVEDPALTAILDRGVRSMGLSIRAVNGLICGGLDTVRDIVSLTSAKELLRIRDLGSVSIREIENFLSESGLSFGMKLTTK